MPRTNSHSSSVTDSNNSSTLAKLNMLRSFVADDAFSETDLSTCLRQANYNVELAAERLITGQYQPAKRQKVIDTQSASLAAQHKTSTPQGPSGRVRSLTSQIRKPTPVTPKSASPSSVRLASTLPENVTGSSSLTSQTTHKLQHSNQSTQSSWLLCHRWISDGVCLQRNGCVDYQEPLHIEHTFSSASLNKNAMVRFRGNRMLGQFPKHLNPMLGPLLEGNWIQIEAQALMEERFLPTGADVAFAVWIYLPDPATFLALLDPINQTTYSASSMKLFVGKSPAKKHAGQTELQQAAFRLLQWAQHGETFDFEAPPKSGTSDESGDELLEDNEDYNPADEEANQKAPDLVPVETTVELQEMNAPANFKVQLRPYQQQALWWMTQREAQEELDESSRQQLELLEELLESSPASIFSSVSTPIQCDCGPVQVDTTCSPAPPVVDNGANPDLKHPLWERRYLTDAPTQTKAVSFYVQPLFCAAMASPPPPPRPCRGGILADSMGLGKTVMLLALIQSSLNSTATEPYTTTLIVTPLSLLAQWQEEIESKTALTYRVYYGDKKEQENYDSVDVVLTTYGSLQGEWLTHAKALDGANRGGLLGHVWKRVILDEAHCVKNTATVASRACCLLQAQCRWCVSGTIIQNSLDDVYALLKFLRHEPWCQSSFWKAAISCHLKNNDDVEKKQEALDRVRRLLAPIMLRRTKDSVDKAGNPILTLPPVETKIIAVDFTPAERQFYDALHRKSLSLFDGFMKAGTASKSWLAIFSLLNRLRQTCDHVALTVKSHIDDDEWVSNISQSQKDTKIPTSGNNTIDQQFLDDLMGKFRAMQSKNKDKNKASSGSQDVDDAPYAAKIAQMLNDAVQKKSSLLQEECPICLDPINIHHSVVTPCFHIFCKDCLVGVLRNQHANQPAEVLKPSAMLRLPNGPCPVCTATIDSSKILRLSQSDERIQTSYLLNSMIAPTAVAVKEGDGIARHTLETAIRGSSSSKLTAILDELDNVWNEEPGSKVLIFSQFLGFLDLMEEAFKKNQIPFSRLDGKLSLKERMLVLQEFGSDHERVTENGIMSRKGSVLLISMKAGGVGLNLVAARTVFISDPWWNAAVEDQCVDRIHRIGQTADKVRVRKFYVSNSVEERIVALQKRKKSVASQVLCDKSQGDSDSQEGSRPSLEDFKILFRDTTAEN